MSIELFRASDIRKTLDSAERRGDDVHELENLRQVAMFLVELIQLQPDNGKIQPLLKSIETRTADFFKKRYSELYHRSTRRQSD